MIDRKRISGKEYTWHGIPVICVVRPDFKKKHKRNCLILLKTTGEYKVVPFRALRNIKE